MTARGASDPGGDRAAPELLELPGATVAAAWLAVLAAAGALAAALVDLTGPLARALTAVPAAAQMPLPAVAGEVRPEPDEQALYLLALVVPPLTIWALCLAARRLRLPPGAVSARVAVAVQIVIALGVVATCAYQARFVHAYFPPTRTALGLVATAGVLAAAWASARSRRVAAWGWTAAGRRALRASGAIAATAAAAYTLARLASVVFDDASILAAPATVSYHLPFTLGEFAAVLNGRTPGVDFFPQYASVLPYALAPVFRVVGLTVATFTLAMAALSAIALMLQFDVLRRVTQRPWIALALYVPLVALAFHPVEVLPNGSVATAFSYFAVGPLRTFGPWVVGWLVAWHLSQPSAGRAFVVFAAAGASALNNLDFGIPALGGAMVALALTGPTTLLPRPRALLALLGSAALGVGAAFVAFECVTWLHSGRFASLSDMTLFQRAFARLGFGMVPLPRWGMHWLLYGTFMLAIGTAVVRLEASRLALRSLPAAAPSRERLLAGVLLYGGVFGAGALSYYVGRSHHPVLPALFGAWGSVLLLLVWLALRAAPRAWRGQRLAVVPALIAAGALAVCAGEALPYRFPEVNLNESAPQRGAVKVRSVLDAPRAAARLRSMAAPGEKVMLGSPAGHLVAELAGVDDVFPFVEWESCLVVGQLDEIVARIRASGVTRYFGFASPELKERVAAAGLPVTFLDEPRP